MNRTRSARDRRHARTAALPAVLCSVMAVAFLSAPPAHGQSFYDYLRQPDFGMGIAFAVVDEYQTFRGKPIPDRYHRDVVRTLGAGIGWNFPMVAVGENMTIGISPNIYGLLGPVAGGVDSFDGMNSPTSSNAEGLAVTVFNVPIFATLKYGTDATYAGRKKFGVAIGVGLQPSWLFATSFFTATPAAMAEISIKGHILWKFRATAAPFSVALGDHIEAHQFSVDIFVNPGF